VLDDTMGVLPWFLPGIAVSMAIGLFACRAVGKLLGVRPLLAWTILVAFGVIVSATLTPLRGALDFAAIATGTCDLSRIGLAPIAQLIQFDDTSLNVALFIPLGIAIGLVPAFGPRATLILASTALPFGIETIQLLTPILDRGCQSADIVDNLTGLLAGIVVGTALRFIRIRIGARRTIDR
jgi:glycopeptide antibiotics resistance protein